jgi:hypothetical protein
MTSARVLKKLAKAPPPKEDWFGSTSAVRTQLLRSPILSAVPQITVMPEDRQPQWCFVPRNGREQPQQNQSQELRLLDHLVGAAEQRRRDRQAERLRSLEVDH